LKKDNSATVLKIGMLLSVLLPILIYVIHSNYKESRENTFYDIFNVSAVTQDDVNVDIEFKVKSPKKISQNDLKKIINDVINKISKTDRSELYETSPVIFNEFVDFVDGSLVSSITTQGETFISDRSK